MGVGIGVSNEGSVLPLKGPLAYASFLQALHRGIQQVSIQMQIRGNEGLIAINPLTIKLRSGGPAALAWGFPIAWLSSLSVYMCLAEMASM